MTTTAINTTPSESAPNDGDRSAADRPRSNNIDLFGMTHNGMVRTENEDQFLIADLKKSVIIHQTSLSYDDETHLLGGSQAKLLLVADGLGGAPAGDRASRSTRAARS